VGKREEEFPAFEQGPSAFFDADPGIRDSEIMQGLCENDARPKGEPFSVFKPVDRIFSLLESQGSASNRR
jgi:hypothetical protein